MTSDACGRRDSSWDVAVVTPTHNRAHLIAATVDALLAQTYPAREIIVVDDGSTDSTPEVMSRYGPPVQYHRIEHGGVCRARNIGVRLSTAPWVAFCDSDDLWQTNKLEWQMRLLQQGRDIEYLFSDFFLMKDRGSDPRTKFERAPVGYWLAGRRIVGDAFWVLEEPLYPRVVRFNPIFPSTVVMSRDFFERVGGFDEQGGRTVSEDVEFTLRCVQHAPVGAVARPLVGIRKHDSNFSRDHLGAALGLVAIYRYARQHHEPGGRQHAALLDEQIARETRSAVELAFTAGQLDIVRDLMHAVKDDPLSLKSRLKLAVARLPDLVAQPLCKALVLGRDATHLLGWQA